MRSAIAWMAAGCALLSPVIAQAADILRPTTIFIAGDSTAANYGRSRAPQTGWGMLLPCALDGTVRVDNRATAGRSTKSFMAEGRLDRIANDIRAGDVLLIQFGHNDATILKPERYAKADSDFQLNLLRFIGTARKVGAYPVLLTPVPRRIFTGAVADESFPAYAAAARQVARNTGTPLIELGRQGAAWISQVGAERAKRLYLHYPAGATPGFPKGVDDDVHFSEAGARGMAAIVARGLRSLPIPIAAHVRRDVAAPSTAAPTGAMACKVAR